MSLAGVLEAGFCCPVFGGVLRSSVIRRLPFTGTGSFRFALVDILGTTTYWSNDGTSATGSEPASSVSAEVDDGFGVYLGDSTVTNMTAIDESVFDNDNLYLRVWFDDGANGSQLLTPDQRVASTAFAARAAKADKVADGAITESMLSAKLLNKLSVPLLKRSQWNGDRIIRTIQYG